MKKITIALIIISSCQQIDKKHEEASSVKENTGVDTVKTETTSDSDFSSFENIYSYTENYEDQKLGVNWISEDSIEYLFKSKYKDCETNYSGIAVNPHPDMDYEVDEDNSGISYPTIQFIDNNYSMNIRIAVDQEMARINFENDDKKDCDPNYDHLLRKDN